MTAESADALSSEQDYAEVLLVDGATGREFHRAEARFAAAWFANYLLRNAARSEVGERPRIALVVSDRFLAAQWTLITLLNDCVVNPLNPDSPREQIEAQLQCTQPDLVVTDGPLIYEAGPSVRHIQAVELHRAEASPILAPSLQIRGDLLLYTSGTTGNPKGVLLRGSELAANVCTAIGAFGFGPGWRTASVLPLFHSFTIISDLLVMLVAGGTCVLSGCCSLNNLPAIYQDMTRYGVMSYSAVPLMFQLLARFWPAKGIPSVRFGISGAAPLTPEVRERCMHAMGHSIVPCYGMTEACCFIAITPLDQERVGSVGLPHGVDLRILDEQGMAVPPGVAGEIAIRGPSVIKAGYFTGGADPRELYQDGYLLTGDIGRTDPDGWVHITGRKKNMMIKAGEKIYLEDVDKILSERGDLHDCASIVLSERGRDDEAACFAVSRGEANEELERSLRDVIRQHMGSRAVPKVIHWIAEIPRTPTGKAKVAELRRLHAQIIAASPAS